VKAHVEDVYCYQVVIAKKIFVMGPDSGSVQRSAVPAAQINHEKIVVDTDYLRMLAGNAPARQNDYVIVHAPDGNCFLQTIMGPFVFLAALADD